MVLQMTSNFFDFALDYVFVLQYFFFGMVATTQLQKTYVLA